MDKKLICFAFAFVMGTEMGVAQTPTQGPVMKCVVSDKNGDNIVYPTPYFEVVGQREYQIVTTEGEFFLSALLVGALEDSMLLLSTKVQGVTIGNISHRHSISLHRSFKTGMKTVRTGVQCGFERSDKK